MDEFPVTAVAYGPAIMGVSGALLIFAGTSFISISWDYAQSKRKEQPITGVILLGKCYRKIPYFTGKIQW